MRVPGSIRALLALVLLAVPFLGSCSNPTHFLGEAKVPNGPDGCRARCTQWGLEFAGMVAMGEYSDGCVCQVPNKTVAPAAAAQAAAVGVALQTRAAEERSRRQMRHRSMQSPSFRR